MGCKYNLDEFKQFTSGKKKINPEPTDDWQLINESYNTANGVALYSKKLNTTVYDLEFGSFLKFLKNENVTMIGDKILGSYVIGQQRVLRKESDYLETMATKVQRVSTSIDKKDWIIGATYETACGEVLTYLGFRYVQSISVTGRYDNAKISFTKLVKKHYARNNNGYIVDVTARKFVKLISANSNSVQECDEILNKFSNDDSRILVFTKIKPESDMKFEVVKNTKTSYGSYENSTNIIKYKNEFYYILVANSWSRSFSKIKCVKLNLTDFGSFSLGETIEIAKESYRNDNNYTVYKVADEFYKISLNEGK